VLEDDVEDMVFVGDWAFDWKSFSESSLSMLPLILDASWELSIGVVEFDVVVENG
jgi:hypothetical protein